ncbi:SMP-30/gluconolactonase/LRE family protein [Polaromonas sp.]|uniref:SMP-30/gluconolactonase/LRE family protein n=1 Tax=Polaromonas sp. TaxID=1869339 RepID=UPI002FC83998
MSTQAELVLDARNATGESPVWHVGEQALYWVDIPARKLCRWQAATGATRHWLAPEMLACIASRGPEAGWVAGMETGVFELQPHEDGHLDAKPLAGVRHAQMGMRFNDGRCDRQGRFLAGTMVLNMALGARTGCVYSYEKDSGLKNLLSGFITPNGLAFSPDGRTMYLSDSHPSVQTVWAFDYDTETGTPANRRVFVDMNPLPGRPDGAAVDEDGCYWICGNDAGLVHRFTPEGRLDRSLAVPVKKPAMCAFGGAGLDTLFVTSIRPDGVDLSDQPLAGGLFALRPGVRGLPEPQFSFFSVSSF